MKILYVVSDPGISTLHKTGSSTHVLSVINGLRDLGHEVKTLIAGDQIAKGKPVKKRFSMHKFFWPLVKACKRDIAFLLHDRQWSRKFAKEAEYFQPGIIYERAAFLHTGVGRISRRMGIPIVMEINSPADEVKFMDGSLFFALLLRAEKRNLLLADAVITVSGAMKDYLLGRGADPKKVYVVHNAADKEVFKFKSRDINSESDSGITLGHVSSFANWYRIDILIEAFALAKKVCPKSRLFIIGDGNSRNRLEFLAKKLNIVDSVIFTGSIPQQEVLDILARQVDIAVSTNISWYGSPTKIFEYGALGKPIIAFNTPAISELIKHQETGLIVNHSPQELCDAIIRLAKDSQLRAALAKNWQAKVLNEYTWDAVALKTVNICKSVLSSKAVRQRICKNIPP